MLALAVHVVYSILSNQSSHAITMLKDTVHVSLQKIDK